MSTWHCKTETVFDYTWNQVVRAYWNRYPNPSSSHVLSEDTISREIRDGKLYSRRLLSKVNPVPKWGEVFYKNIPIKIVEDSVLDLKKKTLITFTRNIGHKKIMKVDEIVEYSEQNDGRTLAVRRAYISSQVFGFSRAICAFGIERFKSNCHKTANGFNHVLRKMFPNQTMQIASTTITTPINTISSQTAASAAINTIQAAANQTNSTGSAATISKTESAKKATQSSYLYLKNQAIKMAQIFSIKN